MSEHIIKKGFDIRLAGKPADALVDTVMPKTVAMCPLEYTGVKQRLKVQVGDKVARGAVLVEDKRDENFKLRAPGGGTIKAIVRGYRRFVERIEIELDEKEDVERFKSYSRDELKRADRKELLDLLRSTGYLLFIRQRPFGRIANIEAKPKSIFVNAMNTGPFQVDSNVVVGSDPDAFQAGISAMARLTDGRVNLCVGPEAAAAVKSVDGAEVHTFSGVHPAGNTSVHISRIDPIRPHDVVWTVKAADLVLIGRLLLDGCIPAKRIVAVGGPRVGKDARKHYRVRIGASVASLLGDNLEKGESRFLNGDVFSGEQMEKDGYLRLGQSSLTVIAEQPERRFLGWTSPGINLFSFSSSFLSTWLGGRTKKWSHGTNRNGGERAMVLTGYYDKVMPLNIMVDFLVRAVLAKDTDEAIRLGILETEPEDFALCDFICPSKMEIQEIIAKGLEMIEEEGI